MKYVVLVCGGRDYNDQDAIWDYLDSKIEHIACIIHGDARGADRIARDWARVRRVPERGEPALWKTWGNAAGPIRNQKMLDDYLPDIVVAFPGGTGTADMVKRSNDDDRVMKVVEI